MADEQDEDVTGYEIKSFGVRVPLRHPLTDKEKLFVQRAVEWGWAEPVDG